MQLSHVWDNELQSVVQMGFVQNNHTPLTSQGNSDKLKIWSLNSKLCRTLAVSWSILTNSICISWSNAYNPHEVWHLITVLASVIYRWWRKAGYFDMIQKKGVNWLQEFLMIYRQGKCYALMIKLPAEVINWVPWSITYRRILSPQPLNL